MPRNLEARLPPRVRASSRETGADRAFDASDELRTQIQEFLRSFGVLRADRTPCGKPLGLSHAHALLVLLERSRLDGAAPLQQDLGGWLGIDKSSIARLCARMEKAGHLVQTPHAEDGRARCLQLTARGRRLAMEVEQASKDRFACLLALVPAAQREALVGALRALNGALAQMTQSLEISKEMSR
jgi:DNA-binding MarR family transcriptional regulator